MANQWHVDWLKEGVIRWNRRRKKVTFAPDLSGIRFFDLLPPDFRDNPKTSHYFEKIDLSDANLASADLSSLNFARALFSHANLSFADLSKSNFQGADFTRANFQGATVQNAYLQNALFYESEIGDALLEGSDVSEAVFIGARIGDRQRGTVALAKARVFSSWEGYIEDKRRHRQLNYADSAQKLPKPDERTRKNRYDVYFGTNRLPKFERGALVDFSGNGAVNLSYGICEVIVPEGHRIGSLGSPMWKRLLNRQDNRLRIDNLIALNRELFWDAVKTVAAKMRIAERPTVFVHGYNSTFQDAVLRAAQIGYDLGLGQGIGLFSWPSKGSLFEYSADEAAAEASKYLLADFLEQFVIDSSQNGVNVISHSMGCRCLLGALEVLANGRKRVLKSINQVILAAADVDSAIMPNLAKHAVKNCKRTISYVSDKDKALKISGWLHNFPRVGITPPKFVFNGMDTVIVNKLGLGNFSHGYPASSRIIMSDIFNLLKANKPPSERYAIESVSLDGVQYWRMKD